MVLPDTNYNLSSAKGLLEVLKQEIEKFPEKLIKLFSDRIKRFSDNDFSKLWRGCNERYISVCKIKAKKSGFKIPEKELNLLREILISKFNIGAKNLIWIIENYRNDKISIISFVSKMKYEIVKISIDIPITWKEFVYY